MIPTQESKIHNSAEMIYCHLIVQSDLTKIRRRPITVQKQKYFVSSELLLIKSKFLVNFKGFIDIGKR